MNKNVTSIFAMILTVFAVAGCSGYSKVLKSRDPDFKYAEALRYMDLGKYNKSAQLLEDVVHFYVGTPREDSVNFYLGLSYYQMKDLEMSSMMFDNFRTNFGRSPFLEEAEYMYAKGFYYMSPEPDRDQTPTRQALRAIDEYLERYPGSPKREVLEQNIRELIQKLHDKAYLNAKTYYNTRMYKSAVVALKNALNQYPDSNHREEIMYLITKSAYMLADNSIEELQRDRFLSMMDAYYNFVSEYPGSGYIRELDKMQDNAKKFLARFGDGEEIEITTTEYGN